MAKFNIENGKKILVLGGTGHLGGALIHKLVNSLKISPELIRVFYLKGTDTGVLSDIELEFGNSSNNEHGSFDFFPGNILNKEDVMNAFKDVDYVFHMIGNTTFDSRLKRIQWLINVEGTRNVLEAYINSGSVKRLCYTSTVNVLGVPNPVGSIGDFDNSDPYSNKPKLHSFEDAEDTLKFVEDVHNGKIKKWWKKIGIGYFDSKLAAQELITKMVQEHDLDIVSVLPGTMFGPYDYLVSAGLYISAIYNNKMPGVLPGGMPFMHVMDSVEGHLLAIQNGTKGERYIITGREEDCLYMKDMAKIIAEVIMEKEPQHKVKIPSKVFNPKLAYIGAILMEFISKITKKPNQLSRESVKAGSLPTFYTYKTSKKKIGYKPKRTFREAVEEMFDYLKKYNHLNAKSRFADRIEDNNSNND